MKHASSINHYQNQFSKIENLQFSWKIYAHICKIGVLLWFIFRTIKRFTCSNKEQYCRGKNHPNIIYGGGGKPKNPLDQEFLPPRCFQSLFWYILSVQKYIHLIVELGFDPLNSWQIFAYNKIFLKTFRSTVLFKYLLTSIGPKRKKNVDKCAYMSASARFFFWYLFRYLVSI